MDITTKTKKLVEKGLVLDERGNWVSLIDKRNKEQAFITRLESGEVLVKKKWMTIKEAKAAMSNNTNLEEQNIPENQLSDKHIEAADTSSFENVCNQPPDDTEMSETNDLNIQPMQFHIDKKGNKSKKHKIKVDDFFYDYSQNETVLFKVDNQSEFNDKEKVAVRRAMVNAKVAPVPIHENVKELLQSFEEFDVWERTAKKRQAMFFAIASGIAAVIGCSAILFLLFT